eukprot:742829-Amphidinium_carterae.1
MRTPNGVATSGGMEVNGGGGRFSFVAAARMCVHVSIHTCAGYLDLDRILAVGVWQRIRGLQPLTKQPSTGRN